MKILLACLATVLLLHGCGGGSADPEGQPQLPHGPAAGLRFTPSSISVKTLEGGSPASFQVTLSLSEAAVAVVDHIEFDDADDVISDYSVAGGGSSQSFTVQFRAAALGRGEHEGKLDFYLCKDESCRSSFEGSPFALDYRITVEAAPPPEVSPRPIVINSNANDAAALNLQVTAAQALVDAIPQFYAGVFDAQGRIAPEVEQVSQLGRARLIRISSKPIPVAGQYTGTLGVFLCAALPCGQGNALPGSQVAVSYTINVAPETLLQPVATASGLPEWETFQGTAAHTGYVPVTLNAAVFADKWGWVPPSGTNTLSPVTAGSGKVVVTSSGYFSAASVFALNEADGSIAWQHDFGSIFAANHPAVWGGRVFVATSGHEDTAMWSFSLASGAVLFRTAFASQWEHYLAPAVKNGYVYTDGGSYGGMYAFKGDSGVQRWFSNLNQYDLWSPAVDDNYAYAYTGNTFTTLNRFTGEQIAAVQNSSFNWLGYALNIAPVLPGDGSALLVDGIYTSVHPNHLIRYAAAPGGESWRADGNFVSNPAVANGSVYALNAAANRLEVRDLATGAMQWTWVLPDAQQSLPVGNLVVTDNLVFLCASSRTYAIDLASHAVAWSKGGTGKLALSSNRVLYIVSNRIDAIDLAPH